MSDAEYLIRREQQELEAAIRSSDHRVRKLHIELANAYTFRLSEMKRQERQSIGRVGLEPAATRFPLATGSTLGRARPSQDPDQLDRQ